MNVIIDTNVLISAALRDRLPEEVVLYVATNDQCRWIVTAEIVLEYLGVIARPKFDLSAEVIRQWADLVSMRTISVPSPPVDVAFPRDPKDAVFLSAAISTAADFLITGDNDLLRSRESLKVTTRILSVAEFATEVGLT
jgi:putative PIN family toxin of toxin-antitoxin system